MTCSICGKGRHFMKDCPFKSKSLKKTYIPSLKPEAVNSYLLPNKNIVYIEYLRSRGKDFDLNLVKNRMLVKAHLALPENGGLVLVNPIETHVTPKCICKSCVE